jgi:hypothetical protein
MPSKTNKGQKRNKFWIQQKKMARLNFRSQSINVKNIDLQIQATDASQKSTNDITRVQGFGQSSARGHPEKYPQGLLISGIPGRGDYCRLQTDR